MPNRPRCALSNQALHIQRGWMSLVSTRGVAHAVKRLCRALHTTTLQPQPEALKYSVSGQLAETGWQAAARLGQNLHVVGPRLGIEFEVASDCGGPD